MTEHFGPERPPAENDGPLKNRESADYARLVVLREDLAQRLNKIDDSTDTADQRVQIRQMIRAAKTALQTLSA